MSPADTYGFYRSLSAFTMGRRKGLAGSRAIGYCTTADKLLEDFLGCSPHGLSPNPLGKFGSKLVALVADWAGFGDLADFNHLSVNNLRFRRFHGMEEVIGSNS
ncbi:hypothetical protein BDD14_1827 [Edaphobacter modestus]|uniref:Uncharacterized protein n=1 Tax=Edaphobacter modestus TaxID=388466 RepID=A0A4Q7YTP0_9BACT|nr:hypothetical protein BDD14_1827 [Edaphobacter modestus]